MFDCFQHVDSMANISTTIHADRVELLHIHNKLESWALHVNGADFGEWYA